MELNEKLLQREESIMRYESEMKQLKSENTIIVEGSDKMKAKQKALQLYSTELQR